MILWPKLRMVLLKEGSAGINAKLFDQNTPQISRSHPKERPLCTPSMDAPKLWSNKKTCNSLGYFTANPRGTKAQDPTIFWNFTLLFLCWVMHYSTSPQHTSRATIKPN